MMLKKLVQKLLGDSGVSIAAPGKRNVPAVPPFVSAEITYAYTQNHQRPEQIVIDHINAAKATVDAAVFSFTHDGIVTAMIDAHNRGIDVRLITDAQQFAHSPAQTARVLKVKAAGIPVKINKHYGLMHLKTTVIDAAVTMAGSFNYTNQASTSNDENLFVITSSDVAANCGGQFQHMWNDTVHFKDL